MVRGRSSTSSSSSTPKIHLVCILLLSMLNFLFYLRSAHQQNEIPYLEESLDYWTTTLAKTNNVNTSNDSSRASSSMSTPSFCPQGTFLRHDNNTTNTTSNSTSSSSPSSVSSIRLAGTCAINLYGLPRAFKTLVLPSLIQNVIPYNPTCDYFLHFYNQTNETQSRAGSGGSLDDAATIMQLFTDAVHHVNPDALVQFRVDTNETFLAERTDLLEELVGPNATALPYQNSTSKLLYRRHRKFHAVESTNLMRMWHSQEAVWKLMKGDYQKHNDDTNLQNQSHHRRYDYVAMLRNDVFFLQPLDILDVTPFGPALAAKSCSMAVVPGFARYPVSDRMIYGPYDAVEPWAIGRFENLYEAAWTTHQTGNPRAPEPVLRSENFVDATILPQIRQRGYFVAEHPSACFVRARADDTLWMSDCFQGALPSVVFNVTGGPTKTVFDYTNANSTAYQIAKKKVENVIGKPCPHMKTNKWTSIWPMVLYCGNSTPPEDPTKKGKQKRVFHTRAVPGFKPGRGNQLAPPKPKPFFGNKQSATSGELWKQKLQNIAAAAKPKPAV